MRNGNIKLKKLREETLARFEEAEVAVGRLALRMGVVEREIGVLKHDAVAVKKAMRRMTGKIRDLFDYVGEIDTLLAHHRTDRKAHLSVE